jgi:hypothetical protein
MTNEIDIRLLQKRLGELEAQQRLTSESLKSGGPGGTSGGMEARVKSLEDGQKRVEEKLDKLVTQSSEIKGQLSAMPSAATFGDIKGSLGKLEGRVDALPTTAKAATFFAIAVAIITIVTKWSELKAALHP